MAKYKVYFTFDVDIDMSQEVGNPGQEISDLVTMDNYAAFAMKAVEKLTDKLHVTAIERDKDE